MQFVMRHAPGARALKFVRRLPLFKGLGDNNLVSVASRMREKVYQVSPSPAQLWSGTTMARGTE